MMSKSLGWPPRQLATTPAGLASSLWATSGACRTSVFNTIMLLSSVRSVGSGGGGGDGYWSGSIDKPSNGMSSQFKWSILQNSEQVRKAMRPRLYNIFAILVMYQNVIVT